MLVLLKFPRQKIQLKSSYPYIVGTSCIGVIGCYFFWICQGITCLARKGVYRRVVLSGRLNS